MEDFSFKARERERVMEIEREMKGYMFYLISRRTIEDVVVARAVEEGDQGLTRVRRRRDEVMVVDFEHASVKGAVVEVDHAHRHPQSIGQRRNVDMVAFLPHRLHRAPAELHYSPRQFS